MISITATLCFGLICAIAAYLLGAVSGVTFTLAQPILKTLVEDARLHRERRKLVALSLARVRKSLAEADRRTP